MVGSLNDGEKPMSDFNRGLDDAFVNALNDEYEKRGWWHRFVNDQEIFVAIRRNSVNAYYRGCSLLKLDWRGGAIEGSTHYKYLLHPSNSNPYLKIVDGRAELPHDPSDLFIRSVDSLNDLKKAAQPFAGNEKSGVHDILVSNHNVLDVEIAFGADELDSSSPRVDFAALKSGDGTTELVFFEAKHFDNLQELRASGGATPKAVEQINAYSDRLAKNSDAIVSSYRRVCENLVSLKGVPDRHPVRHSVVEAIVDGSKALSVDPEPVLIVFGFDADQRDGSNWRRHRKKLHGFLPDRFFLKGDSKKFVRGISL